MKPQPAAARALTTDERLAFDVRGYVVLPGVLNAEQLADCNARLDRVEAIGQAYSRRRDCHFADIPRSPLRRY